MFEQPPVFIIQPGKKKSQVIADAMNKGWGREGEVLVAPGRLPHDRTPVFIGLHESFAPLLLQQHAEQRPFITVDNGYLTPYPHGPYLRVTVNGMQHVCQDPTVPLPDEAWSRYAEHGVELQPWRDGGREVLVVLQSPEWFHLLGMPQAPWLRRLEVALEKQTDLPIRVRRKPKAGVQQERTLQEDLDSAAMVVGLSSQVLVQAAIAGIPVFPIGDCAASPLGLQDVRLLTSPLKPVWRKHVLASLSQNQWSLDEMASGKTFADLSGRRVPEFINLA